MSIDSVMPSNHLILCHPLLLLSSVFPNISLFQRISCSHQVAKVLELQLQNQSFQWVHRVDLFWVWLIDLLAVQETLKSLFQHHNLKALILQHSTFFMSISHILVIPWRRKWQPTPVFLPGKPHGWRNLVGYSPWGHKELDVTEWLIHYAINTSIPKEI